jgi:tyrosyl-tRNA synthetase
MDLLDELTTRGLVQDTTGGDELRALLARGGVAFYCGFDPSGDSLHIGQLLQFNLMTRLARAGHRPVALVGGATGMIGDPGGKTSERQLLDPATLERNLVAVTAQVKRFLPDAVVVNNAEWTVPVSVLTFLRDVGKHITVNYMMAKDSVRARLEEREQGISYTEFSYMLLQAFDFVHLARTHGCRLQTGASDQWGNITCGIELARKMGLSDALHGMVTPLLTTAAGTKFGKSEAGTSLWLDGAKTSPYRLYQYLVNTEDATIDRYLKLLTLLSLDEIAEVLREHEVDRTKRVAQKRLAREVTAWVHGDDAARGAIAASSVMFGGSLASLRDADLLPLLDELPATTLPRAELEGGVPLLDLLVRVGLCESKGAARRLLDQGGVYVNNVREDKAQRALTASDLATESMLVLRAGKKSYHVVRVAS